MTPRPQVASIGSTSSKTARGPDAATVSLPAAITFGLPETGVARNPAPLASTTARIRRLVSMSTVEESAMIRGVAVPVSRPCSPISTSSRSRPAETMMNTTSRPASSTGVSTTVAPDSVSGSALDRVRLYTATS